jgi:hypothetical protein
MYWDRVGKKMKVSLEETDLFFGNATTTSVTSTQNNQFGVKL